VVEHVFEEIPGAGRSIRVIRADAEPTQEEINSYLALAGEDPLGDPGEVAG
jgi:hypothetical protein